MCVCLKFITWQGFNSWRPASQRFTILSESLVLPSLPAPSPIQTGTWVSVSIMSAVGNRSGNHLTLTSGLMFELCIK